MALGSAGDGERGGRMEAVLIAGAVALGLVVLVGYLASQHEGVRPVADALEPRDGYAHALQELRAENSRLLASLQDDGRGGGGPA